MEEKKFAVSNYLTGADIKRMRRKLGFTQRQMAEFANVSQKTIERWEAGDKEITGPVVMLAKLVAMYPQMVETMRIPDRTDPLRLWYMFRQDICTIIDVDERNRKVEIRNFTNDFQFRAFGKEEHPSFEQYEEFLEERCFPRSRDKMKLILKELDIPFYDPMLIIEKTQGRMAEDEFWIRIER